MSTYKDYPDYFQNYFESEADKLINLMMSSGGKPENEWDALDWKIAARILAIEYLVQRHKSGAFESVGNTFIERFRKRKVQDKERILNRADQVDKRAFQEVVKNNINDYSTKAEAIRDLRIKPQFDKYPDKTLRGWLTSDVWTKTAKAGAPKKPK